MNKSTRLSFYNEHVYVDSNGLQPPTPEGKPLCGKDNSSKVAIRGHIEAGEVYHEPGCCGDCKRAVSKALKGN